MIKLDIWLLGLRGRALQSKEIMLIAD